MITIGEKLKHRRTQLELTQQSVADRLHVTRQTISNWENNKSTPDLQSVIDLSEIYNISLDDLLKGDKQMIKKISAVEQLKGIKKGVLALLVPVLVVFYLFPLAMTQGGSEIVVFGVYMPGVLLITSLIYGYVYHFEWRYPLLIALLFIPTIFIYFNSSALIYIPVFAIITYFGMSLGHGLDWLITKLKKN